MDPSPRGVSAIVLAGGKARRFNSEDKGLLTLAGRPLAAWVVERLEGLAAEILISANRNLAAYGALGHTVVPDHLPGQPGPLAGLLACARTARESWLLSVPCDTPFLPLDLVMRLHDQALASQVPLVRVADETGTHFAIMLAHQDLMPDLADFVAGGGRQVQAWQERHPSETLYFGEDPYTFLNINTQDDLKTAERVASRYRRTTL
jgi:molybdenum cofactor guanylyltransferase